MKQRSYREEFFRNHRLAWGAEPDRVLKQYADLVPKGTILDLGIGEGRNALFFAQRNYAVEGFDTSERAIAKCRRLAKKLRLALTAEVGDLRKIEIKADTYSLIICAWVLNFFRKKEIMEIVERMKSGLHKNGLLYIAGISAFDPAYRKMKGKLRQVEKNTFFFRGRKSYIHFFTKWELLSYLKDYDVVYCMEGEELDIRHGTPHLHGIVLYMGRKV